MKDVSESKVNMPSSLSEEQMDGDTNNETNLNRASPNIRESSEEVINRSSSGESTVVGYPTTYSTTSHAEQQYEYQRYRHQIPHDLISMLFVDSSRQTTSEPECFDQVTTVMEENNIDYHQRNARLREYTCNIIESALAVIDGYDDDFPYTHGSSAMPTLSQ